MTWTERLQAKESALCVGLDVDPQRLPAGVGPLDFCLEVVAATREYAACYKPNIAFFERLGVPGMTQFAALLAALRDQELPIIVDAKRGDIGSTAVAYADAYLGGPFAADALTVNPFLGLDTLEPLCTAAQAHDAGLFVLLRTSNPGAAAMQEPLEPLLVAALRAEATFGAVVGATHPTAAQRLREALPNTLFLVPGFGAQGGSDLRPVFRDGRGAVVNSSRGIIYAGEQQADWRAAVGHAAKTAQATIEQARRG